MKWLSPNKILYDRIAMQAKTLPVLVTEHRKLQEVHQYHEVL